MSGVSFASDSRPTGKIISWDIGTKHLCYCLMDEKEIYGWEIINLTGGDNDNETKEDVVTKDKKSRKKAKKRKKAKTTPADILALHKTMCVKLDARPEVLDGVHTVIIENQMMTNQKMKTVAAALYQYYVIRGMVDAVKNTSEPCGTLQNIVYIRPTEKMKVYDGEPMVCPRKTKQNKWLAIEHCRYVLNKRQTEYVGGGNVDDCGNGGDGACHKRWIALFAASKKKDDLADSYLSGLAYLKKHQHQNKKH